VVFKEVDTLFLAFGWIRQFFLDNGIVRIPEYLAFSLETCGMLYWLLIFVFVISLLVGYARQMSSFYFFYQYLMGQKLDNPYKPSIVIAALWVSVQVIATGLAMGGVYFIKYGVLVAIMVAATTVLALLIVYATSRFVLKRMTAKKPEVKVQPVAQPTPTQERVTYQPSDPVIYLQGPSVQQPKANADPQYMEALMILGLKPDFTKEDLQAQYKKLIKKVHADKGGSDGLYLKVKQCYEYLLSSIP
jgi:hypothetical protein